MANSWYLNQAFDLFKKNGYEIQSLLDKFVKKLIFKMQHGHILGLIF